MRKLTFGLVLLTLFAGCKKKEPVPTEEPAAKAPATQPADHVMTNGKVYTVNEAQPWAEAVAVRGSDIVYVGDDAGARAFIGDDTVTVDLKGKMVTPGFVDTHSHTLMVAGIATGLLMDTPLDGRGNKEEMLQAVADWVKAHPDGPFFSFGGAYEGLVDIDRHDIDKIISDRPFVMSSGSGHGGWANTKALEAAGVVKGRPDPTDKFGRDPDGTPNGYLGTSAAMMYLLGKLKLIQGESVTPIIPMMMANSSTNGVTTSFQAGVIQDMEDVFFGAVEDLERSGKLPVRLRAAAYFTQRPMHIERALASVRKYAGKYNSEMFRVDALKIHGDGDFGGRTVGLLEPWADKPELGRGMVSFPDQNQLEQFMIDAAEAGTKYIHMHAEGDRTVRLALDAFENLRQAGYKDIRLSTGHTYMVHPDDVPRFGKLNVSADLHAQFAIGEEANEIMFGEKRYNERFFPAKSILKSGGRLTIGADAPAGTENPFQSLAVIISRKTGDSGVLPPASEKLTLDEAIQAYTINGAYALGMDDIVGSLEVGKRADLVVIDRNLFDLTPAEIEQSKIEITMMNGRVVYRAATDGEAKEEAREQLAEIFDDFDVCESIDERD